MSFTATYWEDRYKKGGNSGLGSHDMASITFKADYVNKLIEEYGIKTLVEYGCGDGNQLRLLSGYDKYLGNDISETIINKCKAAFKEDPTKEFEYDLNKVISSTYDLSLSLDVIYHLVDQEVFEAYMHNLFNTSNLVVMYTTNSTEKTAVPHIKHRDVKTYVETNFPEYELIDTTPFSQHNVMFLTYLKCS